MFFLLNVQGDFFDWSRLKSVGDGKILTKKVKIRVCHIEHRTLLVGFLPSPTLRTFRAGPVKKKSPCTKCTTLFPGSSSSSWSKVVPLQPECNLRQLGQFPKQANTPNSRHSCTKAHANQQKNLFKNCSQILSCFGSTFHADKVMAKGFYLKLLQLHCWTTTRWQKCNQSNVFTTVLPWAKLNAPKKSIRYSDLD